MNELVETLLKIFGSGVVIFALLWKCLKFIMKVNKQRILKKDLHPYFTLGERNKATQYYVPTKCQNIPPSKELEPGMTHVVAAKEKLIPFFINKAFKNTDDDQRFYIILAGSGMGKTTFMINLYLKYISQSSGRKYDIKLLPMGYAGINEEIDNIADGQKKNTILLLDAFDEDNRAVENYKKRLDEIIKKTHRFRKVIITCRTQFFPSEEEEPKESGVLRFGGDKGYHYFLKFYISPFDQKDIKKYLNKKFSIFNFKKRRRALHIVECTSNLMVRPMLLTYIDDFLKSDCKNKYPYEVYEELIYKWIERESMRYKGEKRGNFKRELYKFSRTVAVAIYRNRKFRNRLVISAEEIEDFAKKYGIQLVQMEMKSYSLLNRNVAGEYKFSHQSILEYFLALEAVERETFYDEFNFEEMEQARNFYNNMKAWKEYTIEFFKKTNLKGEYRTSESAEIIPISRIKKDELENLEYLALGSNDLTDITLLKELIQLRSLVLSNNQLTDITPLKKMKQLDSLKLSTNQLTDITPLKELKRLRKLDLEYNLLTDITPLKRLTQLNSLGLNNNQLTDISPLKGLEQLSSLELSNNKVTDISALNEMKGLQILGLSNNKLSDISALKEMKQLNSLKLSINQLADITPLKELKRLRKLDLEYNLLTDITPLKRLIQLNLLGLKNNQLTDISSLMGLKQLSSLGLSNNKITDISALSELKGLKILGLSNNTLSDISALKELKGLEYLHINNNQVSDMSPLKELKKINNLSILNNPFPREQIYLLKPSSSGS